MSKKNELKKAIAESERTLEDLEQKRIRSQSALLYAYINKSDPPEADNAIFNLYTQLIELERKHLNNLREEFEKLN